MDHLNKKSFAKATQRIDGVRMALAGLAGVFTVASDEIPLEARELMGIGELLKVLSRELERAEEFLRSGRTLDFGEED